ncbi:hypothetical protein [Flavobacterium pectinovorum]|jgi:hypothetical protein|uniref:Uncharacterized protein n=1 Tax=Flavobacterium pectinovorum TaxID=29533 RepID=A0A502EIX4_9FLAO|nr:hypothetical protein [Flavobacterium pectinovorum]TPG36281.1 hypothetical protein EAH81_19605 [Flavobacterium pectinovorum]
MKKVIFGMLLLALGFGTMSLTTSSDYVAKTSMNNQKEVEVSDVAFGPTYTCSWNSCCESPITAVERDLTRRGLPVTTNYNFNSTTSTSVTYTLY